MFSLKNKNENHKKWSIFIFSESSFYVLLNVIFSRALKIARHYKLNIYLSIL
jgi:hypothetical protein